MCQGGTPEKLVAVRNQITYPFVARIEKERNQEGNLRNGDF